MVLIHGGSLVIILTSRATMMAGGIVKLQPLWWDAPSKYLPLAGLSLGHDVLDDLNQHEAVVQPLTLSIRGLQAPLLPSKRAPKISDDSPVVHSTHSSAWFARIWGPLRVQDDIHTRLPRFNSSSGLGALVLGFLVHIVLLSAIVSLSTARVIVVRGTYIEKQFQDPNLGPRDEKNRKILRTISQLEPEPVDIVWTSIQRSTLHKRGQGPSRRKPKPSILTTCNPDTSHPSPTQVVETYRQAPP